MIVYSEKTAEAIANCARRHAMMNKSAGLGWVGKLVDRGKSLYKWSKRKIRHGSLQMAGKHPLLYASALSVPAVYAANKFNDDNEEALRVPTMTPFQKANYDAALSGTAYSGLGVGPADMSFI